MTRECGACHGTGRFQGQSWGIQCAVCGGSGAVVSRVSDHDSTHDGLLHGLYVRLLMIVQAVVILVLIVLVFALVDWLR